jgi:ribosomal protein L27
MRQGATKKTKDSAGRRLGLKIFGGQDVLANQIIV